MSPTYEPSRFRRGGQARRLSLLLAGAIVTGVAVLSFLPSGDKRVLHTTGRFHSLGHVLVFSVIAFLGFQGSRSSRARMLVLLGALVFGFGLEYGEHAFFGGEIEWTDVLADAAGVIGGALAGALSSRG